MQSLSIKASERERERKERKERKEEKELNMHVMCSAYVNDSVPIRKPRAASCASLALNTFQRRLVLQRKASIVLRERKQVLFPFALEAGQTYLFLIPTHKRKKIHPKTKHTQKKTKTSTKHRHDTHSFLFITSVREKEEDKKRLNNRRPKK